MLLTGFDAPAEQVMYLDRHIKEAELLQAIARVNRTAHGKSAGYVVDYYGVAENLKMALAAYAAEDVQGALTSVADQVPLLAERRQRVRNLFTQRGMDRFNTPADQEACVEALADEKLRAAFEAALKLFTMSLEIVLPRPEALPHVPDAKAFGAIALTARRRLPRRHRLRRIPVWGQGPPPYRRPRRGPWHRAEDPARIDHRSRFRRQGRRPAHRPSQGV